MLLYTLCCIKVKITIDIINENTQKNILPLVQFNYFKLAKFNILSQLNFIVFNPPNIFKSQFFSVHLCCFFCCCFLDKTSWAVDLFPACFAKDCIRKVNLGINIGLIYMFFSKEKYFGSLC